MDNACCQMKSGEKTHCKILIYQAVNQITNTLVILSGAPAKSKNLRTFVTA